jgi:hypothetical protein
VVERYKALEKANRAAGFGDEADWLDREIKSLRE